VVEVSDKDVEVPFIRCGDKRQALAIGRESGFDIDRASGSHLARLSALQIKRPQLDRIVLVASKDYPAPAVAGRPIRLIVVARPGGKLLSLGAAELLPPQ